MSDLIDRQQAIDALDGELTITGRTNAEAVRGYVKLVKDRLERLPSAQPTIFGYNVEHLELIARVLQKENLPPEKITEVLTDIGRIVAIVRDEFEETLRKAVEQCKI